MKKHVALKIACPAVAVAGFCISTFAAGLNDIPQIRGAVLTNAASLVMSASTVVTNFTVLSTKTNGTLLEITAQNVCGSGTNGVFTYSLGDTSTVIRVVCRDPSNNGMDYAFYLGGTVRLYAEYREGNLDGVYMKFHTNTQVSLFMNTSNNYYIGEGYEFHKS
jgi:hypothetical protein